MPARQLDRAARSTAARSAFLASDNDRRRTSPRARRSRDRADGVRRGGSAPSTSRTASPRPCTVERRSRRRAAGTCGSTRTTAPPIARESLLRFASGTVDFDVPDRYPLGTRQPQPAPHDHAHDQRRRRRRAMRDGVVTWAGAGAGDGRARPVGPARRDDEQGAARSSPMTLTLADRWLGDVEPRGDPDDRRAARRVRVREPGQEVRAARGSTRTSRGSTSSSSVDVNENRTRATRTRPATTSTSTRETPIPARTPAGSPTSSITSSVTRFTTTRSSPASACSTARCREGLADTLAVSITGDHGMGRGFFFTDDAAARCSIRSASRRSWPDDADGEPHDEGEIIGETLWDLRKALRDQATATTAGFDEVPRDLLRRRCSARSTSRRRTPRRWSPTTTTATSPNGTPDECEIDTRSRPRPRDHAPRRSSFAPPTRTDFTVA